MSLEALFQQVESPTFSVEANIASTRKVFFAVLGEHPVFRQLIALIRRNPYYAKHLLMRVKTLVRLQFDYKYVNPFDCALAAYAWALALESPRLARIAAELIIHGRQTWWAREVADYVLENVLITTGEGNTENRYSFARGFERLAVEHDERAINVADRRVISTLLMNFDQYAVSSAALQESGSGIRTLTRTYRDGVVALSSVARPAQVLANFNWSQ